MDKSFWKTVAATILGVFIAAGILHALEVYQLRNVIGQLNRSVPAYPVAPAKPPAAPAPAAATSELPAQGNVLAITRPPANQTVEQRDLQQAEAQKKEAAWQKFYKRPAHCDRPEGPQFVECANQHIRARRAFDTLYAAGKL
jgi:hypothetical protein